MAHKVGKITIAAAVVIIVALVGLSFYMLNFSLKPSRNKGRDIARIWKTMKMRCPADSTWLDSLQISHATHDTTIMAADGDYHHAIYIYPATHQSNKVAVLVHGYTDNYASMLPIAHIYYKLGYGLLLPDLHGNGKSDGNEEQMGWKDRIDVMQWIDVANNIYGKHLTNGSALPQIVVHGVSMGAATVMSLSGERLPDNVKCLVEDCGYTSVWDEFSGQLHEQFGLPDFPLMYTTSALCRLRYGWSFGEASPLRQVAKCRLPMLFIHGGNDTFVPTTMVRKLYNAKPAPKGMWIAHGSAHARSYDDHPNEYAGRVKAFVGKYVK